MFPARYWRKFTGTLTAGERATVAHGLMNGRYGAGYLTPDAVLADMCDGSYLKEANNSVSCYAATTATNVYLSNWDPSNTNYYSIIVRSYHSSDGSNT